MESTKLSSFRESETILYQKTTLIPLYDKRAIISHNKFPIKEIPTAQKCQQRPYFFLLCTVTGLSSVPRRLLTSEERLCLLKHLF